MAKIIIKQVVEAVTESVLRQLMPDLDKKLDAIRADIGAARTELGALDGKVEGLREEMLDRFERQLAVINEVDSKVKKLEGRIEGHMEMLKIFDSPVATIRPRKKVG